MAYEKRLIDANAIPWEEHYVPDGDTQWEYKKELCVLKPTIDAMPTVDAVEVVHGEWSIVERNKSARTVLVECSKCNAMFELPMFTFGMNYNYCPNCGAKMDGGNEDGNL